MGALLCIWICLQLIDFAKEEHNMIQEGRRKCVDVEAYLWLSVSANIASSHARSVLLLLRLGCGFCLVLLLCSPWKVQSVHTLILGSIRTTSYNALV